MKEACIVQAKATATEYNSAIGTTKCTNVKPAGKEKGEEEEEGHRQEEKW